ncbi:TPA: hypothetical protein J1272_004724 [Escherichia coli]|nr:hypothetical protein [Escherichia coli]HBA8976435.1 hypothetical protein [Escherichia coli]
MKKTLIAALVGSACLLSGQAMAEMVGNAYPITVTTTVQAEGPQFNVSVTPATVTADDVQSQGITLASLDISASGLTTTGYANIAVEGASASDYDSARQAWIFKQTSGNGVIYAVTDAKTSENGWTNNMEASDKNGQVAYRTDGKSEVNATTLNIVTAAGNTTPVAGEYSVNLQLTHNVW